MPKKIFELAKELDMGALDLVEVLKTRGYQVRNHMTALTDEEVVKFMAEFKKDSAPTGDEKKTTKKVVKKKVAVKKASSAATEAPKEAAPVAKVSTPDLSPTH
jgi:translation initiation factor IF-2